MILLSDRLKSLRAAAGARTPTEFASTLGIISGMGWHRLERGDCQASDRFLRQLAARLVEIGQVEKSSQAAFRDELLTRKYLGCRSAFLRDLAGQHARRARWGKQIIAEITGAIAPVTSRETPPVDDGGHRPAAILAGRGA